MTIRMTHDQIVPEQYQQILMSAGESISQSSWVIGDITNLLCDQAIKFNAPINKYEIWAAVSHYCGKGTSSVRRYATVAEFYPLEIRERYSELSFSHFSFALQFQSEDQWIEVLDTAMIGPLSVSELKHKYTFSPPIPPSIPVDFEEEKYTTPQELPPYEPKENPRPDIQTRIAYNAVINLRRLMYALPIDRTQVDAIIMSLTSMIQEVQKKLEVDNSVSVDL